MATVPPRLLVDFAIPHATTRATEYSMSTDTTGSTAASAKGPDVKILVHPAVVRVTHWINAAAMLVMISSGWQIYNASPLFNFTFPANVTLGGWLAAGIQWHFAAMWVLVLNG